MTTSSTATPASSNDQRPLTCQTFRREPWGIYLYLYGNSVPEDLFLCHKLPSHYQSGVHLSALLLGSGDIRHILFTLHESHRKNSKAHLEFFMNDWAPEVLARNAVMLYAMDTDPELNPEYLTQLFYSLEISEECYAYWMEMVKECLAWEDWETHPFLRFHDAKTLKDVRRVWSMWTYFNWSKKSMRKRREEYLKKQQSFKGKTLMNAFKSLAEHYVRFYLPGADQTTIPVLEKECFDVLSSGSFDIEGPTKLNPTMHLVLPDGSFAYAMHYGANPFEGHHIIEGLGLQKSVRLNISRWREAFNHMKFYVSGVVMSSGHALHVADDLIMAKRRFDMIDTSNLADHVGHLNLLVSCAVLLKTPDVSYLKTCSYLIYQLAKNRDEYLKSVTGLPKASYSTLLGLALSDWTGPSWKSNVQPFAIPPAQMVATEGRNYEFFLWKKAPFPAIPVSLEDSPFITKALIQSAESIFVSMQYKSGGPGTSNVTPGLFSKMLAFAFAQQRLTTGSGTRANSFPLPCPEFIWSTILRSTKLRGSMSEIFAYSNLFGFPSVNPELCDAPILVHGIFPTPRHDGKTPTPLVFVSLQTGHVHHNVEAINLVELPENRVKISFYAPGFIRTWSPHSVMVQVISCQWSSFGPQMLPAGSAVPFSSLSVDRIRHFDLGSITEAAIESRPMDTEMPLVVENIRQLVPSDYEVVLKAPGQLANISEIEPVENGPGGSFSGLNVDGQFIPISLPSTRVKMVELKKDVASDLVELKIRRSVNIPPRPYFNLAKLPKIEGGESSPLHRMLLGTMYDGVFGEVKRGVKSLDVLSPSDKVLFGLKDNLQILMRDAGISPLTLFQTKSQGLLGCVVYHGMYYYPQVDSAHAKTPMIDASFAFFPPEDTEKMQKMLKLEGPVNCLAMEEKELGPMKKLFTDYHEHTLDQSVHPTIVSMGGQQLFKRCVIHPLYARAITTIADANKDLRKTMNSAAKARSKVQEAMQGGDLAALLQLLSGLGVNAQVL